MNPHNHDWIITRDNPAFRRECLDCGEVQYRKIREEEGAAWTSTRPVHGHDHKWGSIRRKTLTGELYRLCLFPGCDETQRGGAATRPEVVRTDSLRTTPSPLASRLGEHGGVVRYDPATEVVTMMDGATATVEGLAIANPGVHHGELHRELLKHAPTKMERRHGFTPEQVEALNTMAAKATAAGAGTTEFAEAVRKLGEAFATDEPVSGNPHPSNSGVKKWTSDDALEVILRGIRNNPDPMKAAGVWITKFTNGVTDITRNLDDQ